MILACPSCPAKYEMADGALGPQGRKVRCAQCGHTWFAGPNGDALDPPNPAPAAAPAGPTRADIERARRAEVRPHDQMRARIQAKSQKAAQAAAFRAWMIAGFFVAGGAFISVTNRELIVQAWPKAASAYAAVGLKVNAFGLDYFNVKAARSYMGATPVLKVKGEVRNVSKRARAAPDVRIELRDKAGKKIYAWQTQIDALIIAPGEEAPFASYIANPPANAYDVSISFVDEPRGEAALPAKAHAPEHAAHDTPSAAPAAHGEAAPAEASHHAADSSPDQHTDSTAPSAAHPQPGHAASAEHPPHSNTGH